MTDPYRIAAEAHCPRCGIKGRLVATSEDRAYYDEESYDVEVRTCIDCGHSHDAPVESSAEHLKQIRLQWGRLVEGRPYQPPAPKVTPFDGVHRSFDGRAFDDLLKRYYSLQLAEPGHGLPSGRALDLLAGTVVKRTEPPGWEGEEDE